MSRSQFVFNYNSFETTKRLIENELRNSGYTNINENGENVWKCGKGLLVAMKYVKVEFSDGGKVTIYGWIRPMASSEQNLEGFVAAIPKKQVLNVIKKISNLIQ